MELWEKLHRIADAANPSFQTDFLKVVSTAQDRVNLNALQKALRTGNITAAWNSLNWEKVMQQEMTPTIQKHLLNIIAESGPESLGGVPDLQVAFDVEDPQVYQAIKKETATLITNINRQTKQGVIQAVQETFRQGLGPPEKKIFDLLKSAANIRESLGLNQRQMGALNNYRMKLINQGVTGNTYAKLVNQYRTTLLKVRAVMIARTETIQAACEGQRLGWDQAIRDGQIDPQRWEVEWIVTPDDITCDRCMTMKDQRRPINGVYSTGQGKGTKGPTLHPH